MRGICSCWLAPQSSTCPHVQRCFFYSKLEPVAGFGKRRCASVLHTPEDSLQRKVNLVCPTSAASKLRKLAAVSKS